MVGALRCRHRGGAGGLDGARHDQPAQQHVAWRKRDSKSNEAGMKYFLMGAFVSAILLYGIALLYGGTGSTNGSSM